MVALSLIGDLIGKGFKSEIVAESLFALKEKRILSRVLAFGGRKLMLTLLIVLLLIFWLLSWSGPRYYPSYASRYNWYPLWGGSSHILLVVLVIFLLLWLLGIVRI